MGEEASDEQLMMRYRDGEAGAFDVLYRRHKGGLFRYLFRLCGQQSVAEELFQDVWSNIIRSRAQYQPTAKFTTFLYQVAHNRAVDHLRKPAIVVPLHARGGPGGWADVESESGEPPEEQLADDPTLQPENQVERKRLAEALVKHIEGLPAPQREAFLLREEAGLTLEQIAEATGVPMETSKSRLRYAVARLREGLRGMT